MAEEIIDLRDRIEKMRIQIENESTEQISSGKQIEISQQIPNSNISLSMHEEINETKNYKNLENDSTRLKKNQDQYSESLNKKETFPSVSLSVKNPVSNNILILMIVLQIISNLAILYFLYLGMEWNSG